MAKFKVILWPRKGAFNKFPVKISITVQRKRKYIILDFSLKKTEWNERLQNVRTSHPDHVQLNDTINKKLKELDDIAKDLRNKNPTAENIWIVATGKVSVKKEVTKPSMDFFALIDQMVERLSNSYKIRNSERIRTVGNKIYRFVLKYRKKGRLSIPEKGKDARSLPFAEIDLTFIKDFESFLQNEGIKQTTVATDLAKMRKVMSEAVSLDLVDLGANPFLRYKIEKGKFRKKTKLTVDELSSLFNFPTQQGSRMRDAQNLFRFQFYTGGIRIGDCLKLKGRNIVGGRLQYEMQKTDEDSNPKLSAKALSILDEYGYKTKGPEQFIFPFLRDDVDYSDTRYFLKQISAKTALINKNLKLLAKKAGIEKPISTHVARHSMADFLRREGHDLYAISKTLGHSSIKITEQYLASMDQDVVDGSIDALGVI